MAIVQAADDPEAGSKVTSKIHHNTHSTAHMTRGVKVEESNVLK